MCTAISHLHTLSHFSLSFHLWVSSVVPTQTSCFSQRNDGSMSASFSLSLWLTDRLFLPLIIGVLFPTINSFQLSFEHIDPLSLTPHIQLIHTHRPPLGLDNTIWIQLQSAWTPKSILLCKYINIYRTSGLQLQIVWNNVILQLFHFSCCPFPNRYLEPKYTMLLNLGLDLGQLLEYTTLSTQLWEHNKCDNEHFFFFYLATSWNTLSID